MTVFERIGKWAYQLGKMGLVAVVTTMQIAPCYATPDAGVVLPIVPAQPDPANKPKPRELYKGDGGAYPIAPAGGKGSPTLDVAANGNVPVINIVRPNGAGVSHNRFRDYNVGPSGVVVNNSRDAGHSQLGGHVMGNANLGRGNSARLIIQEVTGGSLSRLHGATEIFGPAADLVVANPNGIAVNGASFINTPRVTLSTGLPQLDPRTGALETLQVRQGEIKIGDHGVHLDGLNRFDLVSRRVVLEGDLGNKRDGRVTDIRVHTGGQDYQYKEGKSVPVDAPDKPAIAIDSTALGGMYAGKIQLISTDKGAGVRAPENMASRVEDIVVSADGDVELKTTAAARDIKATSTGGRVIQKAGTKSETAQGAINYDAKKAVIVEKGATLRSKNSATLKGDRVTNQGTITGKGPLILRGRVLENFDTITQDGTLLTQGGQLTNYGVIRTTGRATLDMRRGITNHGYLYLWDHAVLRSDGKILNQPTKKDDLQVGGEIWVKKTLEVRGLTGNKAKEIDNASGSIITHEGGMRFIAAQVKNRMDELRIGKRPSQKGCGGTFQDEFIEHADKPGRIYSAGDVLVEADEFLVQNSFLISQGDITLNGKVLSNESRDLLRIITIPPMEGVNKKKRFLWKTKKKHWTQEGNSWVQVLKSIPSGIHAGGKVKGTLSESARQLTGTKEGVPYGPMGIPLEHAVSVDGLDQAFREAQASPIYQINTDTQKPYLVETRPEFTDPGLFFGSDYFLSRVGLFGKDASQRRRYVDSFGEARLVRQQFEEQGAASLLAAWGDEKTHMERLYGNALEEMKELKLTPFVTLTADQRAQLTRSIVWMEARVVNGEEVLVPVLYLSPQELAKLGRESAQITGQSVSLESPEVSASGLIHGLTTTHVKGQRVTLTGARVDGEDTLVDADLLTNNSSTIAGDTTTINAVTLIAQTLVDRTENAFGYTDVARSQARHTARRGKLTINTGDMAFMGVANHGNQGVDVTSQGTQNLGAQALSRHMELKRKGYEFTRHRERNIKTTFTTGTAPGADVRIHSHGAAVHEGVDATASGKVTKTGDSTFKEKIVYDVDHEESKLRKKGGGILGKKRKHDALHYDKTANRSKLTAWEDITLRFKDDVTVEPIQARSGGKITLKSDEGKTHMATAKEEHVHTSNKSSTDKLWESKSNEGASHDRVLIADLQGAEGEVIEGAKGVILPQVKQRFSKTDGKKKKGKEQVHEAFKDLSQEPGSRYLKTASQQPNVSYETTVENHQEWSMKSQQMTTAAQAVATVVVGALTAGAGSALAGAMGVSNAFVVGAIQGATSAVIGQATTSTINNRGHVGKIAREMGGKESLKGIAIGAATGGLTKGLGDKLKIKTTGMKGLGEQLKGNALRGTVSAGVRVAGGEKVGRVFKSTLVNFATDVGSGALANKIGDWRQGSIGNDSTTEYISHKLMHGTLGAAAGAGAASLMGKSKNEIGRAAAGGAMGAVAAEVVGEYMVSDLQQKVATKAFERGRELGRSLTPEEVTDIANKEVEHAGNMGKVAAGVMAMSGRQDVTAAINAGTNATDNNLPFAIIPVVMGAIKLYDVISTSMEAKEAYDEGGASGLGKYMATQGAMNAVGGAALKVGKVAVKGAGKFAGKVFKKGGNVSEEGVDLLANKTPANAPKVHKRTDIPDTEAQGVTDKSLIITRNKTGRVTRVTHTQEHHIISNKNPKTAEHPIWEEAGMNINERTNTMLLPTKKGAELSTTTRSIHQGRHSNTVHDRLVEKMDNAVMTGKRQEWSQSDYKESLKEIIRDERSALKSGDRILNKNHRPWAKNGN